jgi:hypothetical protein
MAPKEMVPKLLSYKKFVISDLNVQAPGLLEGISTLSIRMKTITTPTSTEQ